MMPAHQISTAANASGNVNRILHTLAPQNYGGGDLGLPLMQNQLPQRQLCNIFGGLILFDDGHLLSNTIHSIF